MSVMCVMFGGGGGQKEGLVLQCVMMGRPVVERGVPAAWGLLIFS